MSEKEVTLNQILEEIRLSKSDLTEQIQKLENKVTEKVNTLTKKVKILEDENSELKTKIEKIERDNKKNSALIFNLEDQPVVLTAKYICHKINSLLELNIKEDQINNVYRLGKSTDAPIKVQFLSTLTKSLVFKNCKKLKNTGIVVSHDLTVNQRATQKVLRRHLQRLKNSTEEKAYIKGDKLYTEGGQSFTVDDILFLECQSETRRTNSAPATPTVKEKQSFEYQEEEELEVATTKLQVVNKKIFQNKTIEATDTPKGPKTRSVGNKVLTNIAAGIVDKRKHKELDH